MIAAAPQPPASASAAAATRKGALFFLHGEFTLTFDPGFMRAKKHEYEMFVDLVKKLRQHRFDARRLCWQITDCDEAVQTLAKLVNWGVTPTKDARLRLAEALRKAAEMAALTQVATEEHVELVIPSAPELAARMKNYQRAGAKFMAAVKRAYNGDDMGLGKSLQTLAALELTQAYPALIICPVKLKQNWLKEAAQWLSHRKVALTVNALAEITILSYSEIHDYVNFGLFSTKKKEREAAAKLPKKFFYPGIVKLKGVACDEGHFIKRKESRRTQACIAIAKLCACEIRFVMSGTPVENAPLELVAPLEFLERMEDMGGWYQFATRYCGATRNNFGLQLKGATHTKELNEKMRRLFYIRRLKGDVLKELPPKIQSIYEAEIDNLPEYRRIRTDAKAVLMQQSGKLLTEGQLQAMAMLQFGMLRKAVGVGKVAWISEWVDTFLESGEKFILYAYHPEVQQRFLKNLGRWNPASVLGGCKDPQAEVDRFQNDESCRLFIGSIVAAGFGLTLTRASHVGIAELMWTQSKHDQTIDRAHRIGQKDCVNAYYFIAPGTIDEDMWEIVSNKAKIVAAVANGQDVPDDQSLQNLVRKFLT